MTVAARRAFGNARVRVLRARLLGPAEGQILRSAREPLAVLRAMGIDGAAPPGVFVASFSRLVSDADKVARAFGELRHAVQALLAVHEIENVKLAWRAVARGAQSAAWVPLWRDLGRLSSLDRERLAAAGSLRQAAEALETTAYAAIAERTFRAHGGDLAAAEMAFDRWASLHLLEAAAGLPRGDFAARELLEGVVLERDVDLLLRAPARGLSSEAAVGATALLRREMPDRAVAALAASASGSPMPTLPRSVPPAADLASLVLALRREQARRCRKAFHGAPFQLAPAVALLLLRDAEARAVAALCEQPRGESGVAQALAGSALEA